MSKTVNGLTTYYGVSGNKVLVESNNDYIIIYTYDVDGSIMSMNYKDNIDSTSKEYFYIKNLQGDVLDLIDETGKIVVSYRYDAWGNIFSYYDSSGKQLAQKNPYRYRSYRFDNETGYYYLQSRYYDPKIGRFLSADDTGYLNPSATIGLNLYAYCGNNPVMYSDSTGMCPEWLKDVGRFVAGTAVTVGGTVATVVISPLLLIPGASSVPLFTANMTAYGAMLVASPFSSTIKSDMDSIGWNPFNSNEAAVLGSQNASFYKGVLVIRYGDVATTGGGGFSFGIIGIGRGETRLNTVRHEYGHHKQQRLMGLALYTPIVAIPSLISASRNTGLVHSNKWYENWATDWGNRVWIWW